MRITHQDLDNPEVDAVIQRQAEEAAGRVGGSVGQGAPAEVSLIHKSWFNLLIAGALGAFAAWAIIEPNIVETPGSDNLNAAIVLLFPSVAACVGLTVGAAEGLLARNYGRAAKGAIVGLLIGFFGSFVALFAAGLLFMVMIPMVISLMGHPSQSQLKQHPGQIVLLGMLLRGPAWAIVGSVAALGPGIAAKSGKMVKNGLVGGIIGGLIGGLLFDPINYLVSGGTMESGAGLSRAIGLVAIGAFAGLMIGLVEMLSRDAWLIMTAGPLKGKQFTVFNNPTVLGSSPQCDVYLFKDEAIAPKHAAIHIVRDGYELEDISGTSGVYVNGRQVRRQRLVNGDRIQVGQVELVYTERERDKKK